MYACMYMMSTNSEKMKTKKWGGGLRLMSRCFVSEEPDHEQHQRDNVHQSHSQHSHHSSRNSPGLPKISQRAPKSSKSENGDEHDNKTQRHARACNPIHMVKDVKELRQGHAYDNVDVFRFEELKLATKHFRPDLILGEGGFGVVYKGVLDGSIRSKYQPPMQVAIKQLNLNGFQGDREWLTEVNYLGQLRYPSLVKLIGYCCDGDQRLLVYEYMAFGSLERHLFRRSCATMTWVRRIKVSLDAAKGLAYLHGLDHPIIYRDLKASNVLLDENFNGKLSDFGLAKEGPMGDQTHVSTRVMGTHGYAAPEYIMTGHLTAMSDVYSFGVVLLELLIGRRVLEKTRSSRDYNLVEICRPVLNNSKKLPRILDSRIDGQYSIEAMMRVANLAYQCLCHSPKGRPVMRQVVQILETVYEQENGHADDDTLFDKKSNETPNKAQENTRKGKDEEEEVEERQSRENRKMRGGRSRSEPQNEYHKFNRNSVDVMTPNLSEMRKM